MRFDPYPHQNNVHPWWSSREKVGVRSLGIKKASLSLEWDALLRFVLEPGMPERYMLLGITFLLFHPT